MLGWGLELVGSVMLAPMGVVVAMPEPVETGVETPLETRVLEPETLLENERVA
jgi:hypothetical protein